MDGPLDAVTMTADAALISGSPFVAGRDEPSGAGGSGSGYPHVPPARRRHGSNQRQRSLILTFRVTDGEREQLERAADREELSIGSYVRARCLAAPETRATKRPRVDRAALASLLGQIGKIGSNLNQIARSENRGRDDEWMSETLRTSLTEMAVVRDAIMQALGRGRP